MSLGLVLNILETCISSRGGRKNSQIEAELASTMLKAAQIKSIINKPSSSHISYNSGPESYGEQEDST